MMTGGNNNIDSGKGNSGSNPMSGRKGGGPMGSGGGTHTRNSAPGGNGTGGGAGPASFRRGGPDRNSGVYGSAGPGGGGGQHGGSFSGGGAARNYGHSSNVGFGGGPPGPGGRMAEDFGANPTKDHFGRQVPPQHRRGPPGPGSSFAGPHHPFDDRKGGMGHYGPNPPSETSLSSRPFNEGPQNRMHPPGRGHSPQQHPSGRGAPNWKAPKGNGSPFHDGPSFRGGGPHGRPGRGFYPSRGRGHGPGATTSFGGRGSGPSFGGRGHGPMHGNLEWRRDSSHGSQNTSSTASPQSGRSSHHTTRTTPDLERSGSAGGSGSRVASTSPKSPTLIQKHPSQFASGSSWKTVPKRDSGCMPSNSSTSFAEIHSPGRSRSVSTEQNSDDSKGAAKPTEADNVSTFKSSFKTTSSSSPVETHRRPRTDVAPKPFGLKPYAFDRGQRDFSSSSQSLDVNSNRRKDHSWSTHYPTEDELAETETSEKAGANRVPYNREERVRSGAVFLGPSEPNEKGPDRTAASSDKVLPPAASQGGLHGNAQYLGNSSAITKNRKRHGETEYGIHDHKRTKDEADFGRNQDTKSSSSAEMFSVTDSLPCPVAPPSALALALARLADLNSQMEFAYAKHLLLVRKHEIAKARIRVLKDLPVGIDACRDDLDKMISEESEKKPAGEQKSVT